MISVLILRKEVIMKGFMKLTCIQCTTDCDTNMKQDYIPAEYLSQLNYYHLTKAPYETMILMLHVYCSLNCKCVLIQFLLYNLK